MNKTEHLSQIKAWAEDRSGAIAILFAVLFPVVLLLIGSSLDYASALSEKTRLQAAVDKAAAKPPAATRAITQFGS